MVIKSIFPPYIYSIHYDAEEDNEYDRLFNDMAFDLEKLAEMATPRSERAKDKARFRKENREWLRMSQDIALAVHYYLRNNGMSQKELAEKMGVSPAYIGKLLKGRENLTLETICKLQSSIGLTLISVAQPYVSFQNRT